MAPSLIAPASQGFLAAEFHVSATLINLTLTTYMIFQGFTPLIIGDLADSAGRRPAYIYCFIVYIGANIGLALCPNYAALLVLLHPLHERVAELCVLLPRLRRRRTALGHRVADVLADAVLRVRRTVHDPVPAAGVGDVVADQRCAR